MRNGTRKEERRTEMTRIERVVEADFKGFAVIANDIEGRGRNWTPQSLAKYLTGLTHAKDGNTGVLIDEMEKGAKAFAEFNEE